MSSVFLVLFGLGIFFLGYRFYSHFIGHPTKKVPGIEHNTGALGHGLSVAVGLAIAQKLNKENFKIK